VTQRDDVALNLAPEVDVAIFASADNVVEIWGESGAQVEGFVLVAFYLHDAASCHHIDETDTRVVGSNHGNVHIKEVNTSNLATSRELSVIIFHVD